MVGLKDHVFQSISNQVTDQLRKVTLLQQDNIKLNTVHYTGSHFDLEWYLQQKQKDPRRFIEKGTFSRNFDIENIMTLKSNLTVCYKMRDRRFLIKKLPKNLFDLEKFKNIYEASNDVHVMKINKTDWEVKKHKILNDYMSNGLLLSWLNAPPQVPVQNFVNCYGLLKIDNDLYTVSDIVEDNVEMHYEQYDAQPIEADEGSPERSPS